MAQLLGREVSSPVLVLDREEQILRAAARVFREHGYHGASVRSIAARVGLGKSGLYHHIDSKQELLGKIVDRGVTRILGNLSSIVGTDASPSEKLRMAIEQHIEALTDWLDGAFVALLDRRSLTHEHLANYIQKRDRYESLFRQIIDEGIAAGQFRPVSTKYTTSAVLQMVNGVIYWYNPAGPLSPQQIAANFFDLTYAMLKKDNAG